MNEEPLGDFELICEQGEARLASIQQGLPDIMCWIAGTGHTSDGFLRLGRIR